MYGFTKEEQQRQQQSYIFAVLGIEGPLPHDFVPDYETRGPEDMRPAIGTQVRVRSEDRGCTYHTVIEAPSTYPFDVTDSMWFTEVNPPLTLEYQEGIDTKGGAFFQFWIRDISSGEVQVLPTKEKISNDLTLWRRPAGTLLSVGVVLLDGSREIVVARSVDLPQDVLDRLWAQQHEEDSSPGAVARMQEFLTSMVFFVIDHPSEAVQEVMQARNEQAQGNPVGWIPREFHGLSLSSHGFMFDWIDSPVASEPLPTTQAHV